MNLLLSILILLSPTSQVGALPDCPHGDTGWDDKDWKCPNDELCLRKHRHEVCAPPPYNITRCPNGGDFGADVCNKSFCESIGLYKCPYDPFCVDYYNYPCEYCPNGASNETDCSRYVPHASANMYANCTGIIGIIKYYDTYVSCDNEKQCLDGSDEEGCVDDGSCQVRTRGFRKFKCPLDGVCLNDNKRFCTCPSGVDVSNNTVCNEEHCNSLELTGDEKWEYGDDAKYKACNTTNKCIGQWQMCDGYEDCANGEDEKGCTKERFKCPFEDRHINERFVCDNDNSKQSQYNKNKCILNSDEYNDACIWKCHQQGKYVCPSEESLEVQWNILNDSKYCLSKDTSCNIPKYLIDDIPQQLLKGLFHCSQSEYIHSTRVCDKNNDCHLNEDEYPLNKACDPFPLELVICITIGTVFILICLMIGIKRAHIFPHPKQCNECMKDYQHYIGDEEWNKKRRLMLLLMNNRCTEWGFVKTRNLKKLERTYKQIHEDNRTYAVKDVYQYITRRIDSKFTLKNMMQVMHWRHESICKPIYNFEMKLHKGNEVEVLKCLKQTLGTGAEAYLIIDYQTPPTMITKTAVVFNTLGKYVEFHKAIMPIVKSMAFVSDIAKDIALTSYIGSQLYGSTSSDDVQSHEDYYLHGIHVVTLFMGQMVISVFAFLNRYRAYSVCPHNESRFSKGVLYSLTLFFFPLSGITMATEQYLTEKDCERYFKNIPKNWAKTNLQKEEFEQIITQIRYTESKQFGGFATIKMIENAIESFWQLVLLIVIYSKLPHEGVLTITFLGLSPNSLRLFIIFSVASYVFIATGILSFVCLKQKSSMGMKEKLTVLIIYLLKTGICMFTTTLIFLVKSSIYHNLAFLLWLSLVCFKTAFLCLYSAIGSKAKRSFVDNVMFIVSNINLPIHFDLFDNAETVLFSGQYSLHGDLIFVFGISLLENILRLVIVVLSDSNRAITKTFPRLSNTTICCIVFLTEIIVAILLNKLWKSMYIWHKLLGTANSSTNRSSILQFFNQNRLLNYIRNKFCKRTASLSNIPTTPTDPTVIYNAATKDADEACRINIDNETAAADKDYESEMGMERKEDKKWTSEPSISLTIRRLHDRKPQERDIGKAVVKQTGHVAQPSETKSVATRNLEPSLQQIAQLPTGDEKSGLKVRNWALMNDLLAVRPQYAKKERPTRRKSEPLLQIKAGARKINEEPESSRMRWYSLSNLFVVGQECDTDDVEKFDARLWIQTKLSALKGLIQRQSIKTLALKCLGIVIVCIAVCVPTFTHEPTMKYQDCHELRNKDNGVYDLNIAGKRMSTYCKDGMTLIQITNPDAGNPRAYFNRPLQDYANGFGYVSKEMFLGLDSIVQLNNENTVLRLEMTMQENVTKVWVEYHDFQIKKYELDNIPYVVEGSASRVSRFSSEVTRNKTAAYPIKTLGNVTSSINGNGQFVLVWPNYLKSPGEKKYDRTIRRDYHDYMYAGFHTLHMDEDYECSREYKSGWWFPHRVRSEAKTKANTNGNCYHNISLHTNLNGVYHHNITKNQRQISYCNSENVEDCFMRSPPSNCGTESHYRVNGSYIRTNIWCGNYNFTGLTSIKIKHTQLWLKRRRRG